MDGSTEIGVAENLHILIEKLKNPDFREALAPATLIQVVDLYISSIQGVETREDSSILQATEAARLLRNSCAGCKKNQDVLNRKPECFQQFKDKVKSFCSIEKSEACNKSLVLTLLKCSLQMVGNSTVQHPENGKLVWATLFDEFRDLLDVRDPGLFSCCCMVLHSCLLADPAVHVAQLVTTPAGQGMICTVLDRLLTESNEWGLFIIEKCLSHPNFLQNIYRALDDDDHRHLLLDIVDTSLDKPSVTVAADNLVFVCEEFKRDVHCVLGLSQGTGRGQMESSLVVKLLSVLCSVTSDPKLYPEVIDDNGLLKCSINLLQCIHLIGAESDNVFSPVSKVSKLTDRQDDQPVYGLKRDIIRLLANMTYQHRANQDLVRELGGIPLILDHTNIDSRNPFITQWSVFAVRNLLDGNPDNQAVVAGMRLTGLADNVDKLREFGVEAELKDGQVVVKGVKDTERSPFAK